jgi:plasmid maintenance system antidote protein VapI
MTERLLSRSDECVRTPAEVVPVGDYIQEELTARGWTTADLAERMGDTYKERAIWELTLDLLIVCGDRPDILLGQETADALGKAFGTSGEFWSNLHAALQVHLRVGRERDYFPMPKGAKLWLSEYEWRMVVDALRKASGSPATSRPSEET